MQVKSAQVADVRGQHWALLPFVTGILVGLSVSTVVLVRPYTEERAFADVHVPLDGFEAEGAHSRHFKEKLLKFEEIMEEFHSVGHRGTVQRTLAEEVTMKDPVFYAVILSAQYSSDVMISTLRNTWARDIPDADINYYISSAGARGSEVQNVETAEKDPNIIRLSADELDEIQVLEHVCEHKINTTKWFFFGYDMTYVKTRELETYLLSLEASQEELPYIGKPIKRDPVGRLCLPGPGSLLSYLALTELCPKLNGCMKMEHEVQTECLLGECIRKQLPNVQCAKDGHSQNLFLRFDGNKKGPIISPKHSVVLNRALTVYPVADPKLMYNIHQLVVNRRLNTSQYFAQELKQTVDQMVAFLPQSERDYGKSNGEVVPSREDIESWKLINHNRLMIECSDDPAIKIPGYWKTELDTLTSRAMEYLKSLHEDQQLELNRVVNAYWRLHPLSGLEYVLEFEAKTSHTQGDVNPPPRQFCAHLSRPYNPPEVSPIQPQIRESKRVTIALIMTGEQLGMFEIFMKRLEQVLQQDQRLFLIVVKMKTEGERQTSKKSETDSTLESIIHSYETQYLRASFKAIISPYILSRSYGLALVLREVRPTDLLFLADLYLVFDTLFLERCRNLPRQGQQVYYPIPFAADAVSNTTKVTAQGLGSRAVSSQLGHWLVKSRGLCCVYAADVLSSMQKTGGKGIPKEVDTEELLRQLIEKDYEVILSLDAGLWRAKPKESGCELDLVGDEQESCKVVHDYTFKGLRVRTKLSELLFDHEGKQSENKF